MHLDVLVELRVSEKSTHKMIENYEKKSRNFFLNKNKNFNRAQHKSAVMMEEKVSFNNDISAHLSRTHKEAGFFCGMCS
jgi:hypothetical protein